MNPPIVDQPGDASDDGTTTRLRLQAARETNLRESKDQVAKPSTVAIDEYWNGYRPADEAALRRNLDAERWQMGNSSPHED